MRNLVVFALDLSKRRTGWAIGWPDMPRPMWGVYETAEWDKVEGKRLTQWRRFLSDKIEQHSVTYVAMERLIIPPKEFNYDSHIPMAQLHGQVVQLCDELGIRCGAVAISTWRSHWLGQGTAPKHLASKDRTPWLKDAALKQALKRNWYCQYHDEAEALGIMDYALFCLDPDYEHKVGPLVRRAELKAEIAAFRGESP